MPTGSFTRTPEYREKQRQAQLKRFARERAEKADAAKPKSKKPPPPRRTVFEHVTEERKKGRPHDDIAKRVTESAQELNDALQEAYDARETRVEIGFSPKNDEAESAGQITYSIYRLTHETLVFKATWHGRSDGDKPT